jgi:hypothetical protein
MLRQVVERHYHHWLDDQILALGGHRPSAAAASITLRPRLIALLKELEIRESAKPKSERYELGRVWRALGLDPLAAPEGVVAVRSGIAGVKQPSAPRLVTCTSSNV